MIMEVADRDVPFEEQNKIVLATLNTKMSMKLGTEKTIQYFNFLAEGHDTNLQHSQTAMYIQALWEWNWGAIKIFSVFNAC